MNIWENLLRHIGTKQRLWRRVCARGGVLRLVQSDAVLLAVPTCVAEPNMAPCSLYRNNVAQTQFLGSVGM